MSLYAKREGTLGNSNGSRLASPKEWGCPANNATFTAPATITIDATASDTDGTISQVEFFQRATPTLGVDTSAHLLTFQSRLLGCLTPN